MKSILILCAFVMSASVASAKINIQEADIFDDYNPTSTSDPKLASDSLGVYCDMGDVVVRCTGKIVEMENGQQKIVYLPEPLTGPDGEKEREGNSDLM